jgi:hypothetical protein
MGQNKERRSKVSRLIFTDWSSSLATEKTIRAAPANQRAINWHIYWNFIYVYVISFEFHVFNGIVSHHYTSLSEFNVSLISLARRKRHSIGSPSKSDPLDTVLRIFFLWGSWQEMNNHKLLFNFTRNIANADQFSFIYLEPFHLPWNLVIFIFF